MVTQVRFRFGFGLSYFLYRIHMASNLRMYICEDELPKEAEDRKAEAAWHVALTHETKGSHIVVN